MSRYLFVALSGLLASIGPSLAQPNSQDLPPSSVFSPSNAGNPADQSDDVKIGDRWTYESRDEITGEIKATLTNVVTDISSSEVNVRITALGKSNSGYLVYDRQWNLKDNGTWRMAPHDGSGIRLPLEVGKAWFTQATLVNAAAGPSFKQSGQAKIVAKETVTTAAGTFDTFRIDESHTISGSGSSDPTKKLQIYQQTWYSPQVNHWVKRTFLSKADGHTRESTTTELVEYGRR